MGIKITKTVLACAKCGNDKPCEFAVNDAFEIYCKDCLEVWGEGVQYK